MHTFSHILLFCMLAMAAHAQDSLYVDGLDVSAYPELQLSLRVVIGGAPVLPLDPGRVVVREHGSLSAFTIDCPAPRPKHPSIALGFERSLDGNFPRAEAAAHDFISRMGFTDDGAEASLWSFATTVDREVDMSTDSARLHRAVDDLSVAQWPFNGTALYETMHRAIEDVNAAGSGEAKAIVFFTDGYNNSTWFGRSLDDVRGRAAVDGIRVYVILVKNRDEGEAAMLGLCQSTGGFMVMHDAAGAADLVYRDIIRPDSAAVWCELTTQSPSCANGTSRLLEIGYVRGVGDTLWNSLQYDSPRVDDELQPLYLWASPTETFSSDTLMTAVIGVEVRDGEQLAPMSLVMDFDPAQLLSAEPLNWNTTWQDIGTAVLVWTFPPASGLVDGFYPLLRLRLRIDPSLSRELRPSVQNEVGDCYRSMESIYPAEVMLALDTTLVNRRGEGFLEMRVPQFGFPEGLQRLDVAFSVDAEHASFATPIAAQSVGAARGWSLLAADIDFPPGEERLRLRLSGDADSAYQPLRIPLRTAQNAPYRISVHIEHAQVNELPARVSDGLLVVRDSCYNNVVALTGLNVSQPWPQPAREQVHLEVRSADDITLRIHIVDELGRDVAREAYALRQGAHILTLDLHALDAGRYSILCEDGTTRITHPLLLLP